MLWPAAKALTSSVQQVVPAICKACKQTLPFLPLNDANNAYRNGCTEQHIQQTNLCADSADLSL